MHSVQISEQSKYIKKDDNVKRNFSITGCKFEQWGSTIPPISKKRTNTSLLLTKHKKNNAYDVGNPGSDLWQTYKFGGIKPVKLLELNIEQKIVMNIMTMN